MQNSWGWQGTRPHHPGALGALCPSCQGIDNSLFFLKKLLAEAVLLNLLLLKDFVRLEHLAGETGRLFQREAGGFGFLSRYGQNESENTGAPWLCGCCLAQLVLIQTCRVFHKAGSAGSDLRQLQLEEGTWQWMPRTACVCRASQLLSRTWLSCSHQQCAQCCDSSAVEEWDV